MKGIATLYSGTFMERVVYTLMSGYPGEAYGKTSIPVIFLIFRLDKHDAISYNTTQLAK